MSHFGRASSACFGLRHEKTLDNKSVGVRRKRKTSSEVWLGLVQQAWRRRGENKNENNSFPVWWLVVFMKNCNRTNNAGKRHFYDCVRSGVNDLFTLWRYNEPCMGKNRPWKDWKWEGQRRRGEADRRGFKTTFCLVFWNLQINWRKLRRFFFLPPSTMQFSSGSRSDRQPTSLGAALPCMSWISECVGLNVFVLWVFRRSWAERAATFSAGFPLEPLFRKPFFGVGGCFRSWIVFYGWEPGLLLISFHWVAWNETRAWSSLIKEEVQNSTCKTSFPLWCFAFEIWEQKQRRIHHDFLPAESPVISPPPLQRRLFIFDKYRKVETKILLPIFMPAGLWRQLQIKTS